MALLTAEPRYRDTMSAGRKLLSSAETSVTMSQLTIASFSEGPVVELAVRRVVACALLLSGIIGTLIVMGAVPPLIGAITASWLIGSGIAVLYVRRRRGQLGRLLMDLEAGTVVIETLRGNSERHSLSTVAIETTRSADASAPVWVLLVAGSRLFRMGRGSEVDAERLLGILRGYHLLVKRRDVS